MANKNTTPRRVRRERRRLAIGAAAVGVVVIAVVVGYFAYRAQADLPGQKFPSQGNLHVQTVNDPHEPYNSTPPTSGPHLPYIAPWGVHTKPIANELQVHNLEDGGVMVQYNCECPELAEKLAALVRRHDRFVVLAPYPTMKSRIALTAWTRLETLDDFDAGRIERFIKAYRGIDHHPR
jgi:Protein of unknown function (DUF3105)